jgi:hypothetical protein
VRQVKELGESSKENGKNRVRKTAALCPVQSGMKPLYTAEEAASPNTLKKPLYCEKFLKKPRTKEVSTPRKVHHSNSKEVLV